MQYYYTHTLSAQRLSRGGTPLSKIQHYSIELYTIYTGERQVPLSGSNYQAGLYSARNSPLLCGYAGPKSPYYNTQTI